MFVMMLVLERLALLEDLGLFSVVRFGLLGLVICVTNLSHTVLFSNWSCFKILPLFEIGSSLGIIARGAYVRTYLYFGR
jgi:hypothetical protein